MATENRGDLDAAGEPVSIADLLDQLDHLHETVDTEAEERAVQRTVEMTEQLSAGVFGERISKYTSRDVAEAFVGSIVFAVPLLVEDGVFEIAAHFLAAGPAGVPAVLLANAAFVVLLTGALIYWADIQRVDVTTHAFGVPIPRRLIGTLLVSLATATVMMTMWGRVEGWADPAVGLARVSVVWTAAAIGAALGDILPGESAGEDLGAALGDELGGFLEGRE